MIWHIFKKDARLLWPMAALVAALHVCAAIPRYLTDHGRLTAQLAILSDLLSALALLGVTMLVVVAVQQDPAPGTRQDWLIRPIRRGELALAKLLFVGLMVQAPMWLVDVGIGMVDGFAFPSAGVAAASRGLEIFCEFALPSMMIAVITRTFVEAFVVWAIGIVVYVSFFQIFLSMLMGIKATVTETGAAWIFTASFDLLALAGAAVILTLQYSGRRTALARALVGLGGAMVIGAGYLPWHVAFGMQTAMSPQAGAAHSISVAFDEHAARYRLPLGAAPAVTSALHLPLRFTGLPVDSSVLMDRADVRIMGLDGTTLYQGKSNISVDGLGSMADAQFEVRAGQNDGPVHSTYQRIYLPTGVYVRLADRPVRMAIDYSLTVFGSSGNYSLPATGGRVTLPGLGRCATGIDAEGDDVVVGCLSATRQSSCYTGYLEQPATGLRNPEAHFCRPSYAPAVIGGFWPDALNRTGGELRFFDRSGLVRFPVDGPKLASAKLIIETFEPRDHFTRHVDSPVVRLSELTGLPGLTGPAADSTPLAHKLY
jgi:hypothetical protein